MEDGGKMVRELEERWEEGAVNEILTALVRGYAVRERYAI